MRKTTFSIVATMLVLATGTLSGPAAATTTGMAIGMCAGRGTECKITANADGGYHICVQNDGGEQCVDCPPIAPGTPPGGTCTVSPSKVGGGTVKGRSVDAIMQKQAPSKAR